MTLLLLGAVALGGCFTITEVAAPSGPPSSDYVVTLEVAIPDASTLGEEPGAAALAESRGVLAMQFPSEWRLLSATYSGAVSGNFTYSPVITAYFDGLAQAGAQDPMPYPGISIRSKPGYVWWAGYSGSHPDATAGSLSVQLTFDQGAATGAYHLDFLTGVADALAPEDPDAMGAAWDLGGVAMDQPVFTGVAPQNVPPQVFLADEKELYAAVGELLSAEGAVFDPDAEAVDGTVDFDDGMSEPLLLSPLEFALGVWDWQWQHAWQTKGTYTVRVQADDGVTPAEVETTVHVGESPFSDVTDSHRFYQAILDLWRTEVIAGYPDGTFRPEQPVLRAQLAKMAVLGFGYHDDELTNPDSPTFIDVLPGDDDYPYDYVEEAALNNLVAGFADNTFRPWDRLTRVQLVRVIVRAQVLYLREPPAGYQLPFTDVDPVDRQYLAIAHYNGLVQGKDGTHFDPYGTATRGHLAQVLYNALHVDLTLGMEGSIEQAAAAVEERAAGPATRRAALFGGARALGLPGWVFER